MVKKLYIGNLDFKTTEEEIRQLFSQHGEVLAVKLIADIHTGRPRGFGFLDMENADEAAAALNTKEFNGRPMKVTEARERQEQGRRGFGGGGSRGFGGGGGGNRRGPSRGGDRDRDNRQSW